jgi:hypothetical protein
MSLIIVCSTRLISILLQLEVWPIRTIKDVLTDFGINTLPVDLIGFFVHSGSTYQPTLRSSIWKNIATKWQMVFHQGTVSCQSYER